MKTVRVSLFGLCFAIFAAACSPATSGDPGTGGNDRHGGNWRQQQLPRVRPLRHECVNTATDSNNCGAAASPVGGKTCQNSKCACPSGQLECNGSCVPADAAHCGSCTNVCAGGETAAVPPAAQLRGHRVRHRLLRIEPDLHEQRRVETTGTAGPPAPAAPAGPRARPARRARADGAAAPRARAARPARADAAGRRARAAPAAGTGGTAPAGEADHLPPSGYWNTTGTVTPTTRPGPRPSPSTTAR